MLKERLSKISIRIFYIIFAVLVSVTLWLYVEITEKDMQTATINNIPVELRNQEILHDRGLLVSSLITDVLSLTIEASRSDISRLSVPGALIAEVDLANITAVGTVPLSYQFVFPQGFNRNAIEEMRPSDSRVILIIDRMQDRQIEVKVDYTGGTASDELMDEPVEFDPRTITVWGPEELISKISYARVPIFRENLALTYTEDLEFILIDDNGEVISDEIRESIEFSHETVRITVPIKEVKEVMLQIELFHGETTSELNSNRVINPQYITVSGDPEALREFNSITLGTIDMTSFSTTFSDFYPIILPNHLANISGETSALVTVDVIGLSIAHRSVTNISTTSPPAGLTANILTQSIDVRIRGVSEDLIFISPLNIRVVADLTDRNTGTARIPATVYIDGIDFDLDIIGEYLITVELTEIQEE